VQTRLCEFCIKSGILCSKCLEKINSGEISSQYINVAKKLLEYHNKFPFLQDVCLDNVYDIGDYLVLEVKKNDLRKFEDHPRAQRDIGDAFNKRTLIIESGVKDRKFLEDLFASQHLVTINIIWLPDGSTETRVVLRGRGIRRLSKRRIEALRKIAKKVKGMDLRVEYTY
jgi:hypothetical protein